MATEKKRPNSMDPRKWIAFDELTTTSQARINTLYPFLKLEMCRFQEKQTGVFFKQMNSVKVEKLLDPSGA